MIRNIIFMIRDIINAFICKIFGHKFIYNFKFINEKGEMCEDRSCVRCFTNVKVRIDD